MPLKVKKLLRRRDFLVMLFIITAFAIGLYFLLKKPIELPPEFLTARQSAALVSAKIVSLTNATNEKIKAVNLSDLNDDSREAYNLIQEARKDNAEAYSQAFELSRNLQKIAESLGQVSSLKSQRLAYEAVAIELALVSEFITYTQNLNDFLNDLSTAVITNDFRDRQRVKERVIAVNQNVEKINALNKEFIAKIENFDKSL